MLKELEIEIFELKKLNDSLNKDLIIRDKEISIL